MQNLCTRAGVISTCQKRLISSQRDVREKVIDDRAEELVHERFGGQVSHALELVVDDQLGDELGLGNVIDVRGVFKGSRYA